MTRAKQRARRQASQCLIRRLSIELLLLRRSRERLLDLRRDVDQEMQQTCAAIDYLEHSLSALRTERTTQPNLHNLAA